MKIFTKIILVVLIGSLFLLAACGPKPPSIAKQDFDDAKLQAETIEFKVSALRNTKNELETEFNAKTAKLEVLLELEAEEE